MSEVKEVRFTKVHKDKIAKAANEYLELCEKAKAIDAEKSRLKKEISEYLKRFGIDSLEWEDVKVSSIEYIREGVDVQALKQENLEVFEQFAKTTTAKRLDIRRRAVLNEG